MQNWFDQIYSENTSLIKISNLNYEASLPGQKKKRVVVKLTEDMFSETSDIKFRKNVLWQIIRNTPNLMWIIVTDSIQHMKDKLPVDWASSYSNCCILSYCKNQQDIMRAFEHTPSGKERLFGLYIEDLEEQVDLSDPALEQKFSVVIVGNDFMGESKPNHPDWIKKISDDCFLRMPMFYEGFGKYSLHKIIDNGITVPPVGAQIREKLNDMMVWSKDKWVSSLPMERIKVRKLFQPGCLVAVANEEKDWSGVIYGMPRKELPAAMM